MILNKLKNLNYLLIFVLFFLCIIGSFGLYSAADGSFEPWAAKHMIRFSVFLFCTFFLSLIDIKRNLLVNGSIEITDLDSYAELVHNSRAEILNWIRDKGSKELKEILKIQ